MFCAAPAVKLAAVPVRPVPAPEKLVAVAVPATNKLFAPAPVPVPIETPPPLDRRMPSVPFALNITGAATSVPNTNNKLLAS